MSPVCHILLRGPTMRSISTGILLILSCTCQADDKDVKPLSPAQAAKRLNEMCTVEMEVKSTGTSKTTVFLNSEANFRDDKNFTIVIGTKAADQLKKEKIDDPAAHFKGKTIRVTGTVTLYKERPQIRVEEAKQIMVVTKKSQNGPV